jgi:hypothetical protein
MSGRWGVWAHPAATALEWLRCPIDNGNKCAGRVWTGSVGLGRGTLGRRRMVWTHPPHPSNPPSPGRHQAVYGYEAPPPCTTHRVCLTPRAPSCHPCTRCSWYRRSSPSWTRAYCPPWPQCPPPQAGWAPWCVQTAGSPPRTPECSGWMCSRSRPSWPPLRTGGSPGLVCACFRVCVCVCVCVRARACARVSLRCGV